MWISADYLITENPRCGVAFLARHCGAVRVPGAPLWALPGEARAFVSIEDWRTRKVLCPVRDPVTRFISAVRSRFREEFPRMISPGDDALANETLALMRRPGVMDDPRYRRFLPQQRWLSARTHLIIPVESLADFAGSIQSPWPLSNRNAYPFVPQSVSAGVEADIRAFYAEDYAMFAKTPVWSPVPGEMHFLGKGRCLPCEAKRAGRVLKQLPQV